MIGRIFIVAMATAGIALFAEGGTTANQPQNGGWENLTALGCVIGALMFIVMKMLPDLHQKSTDQSKAAVAAMDAQSKTFATTVENIQEKFSNTLDKMHERGTAASASNTEELAKLREHCAEMHGRKSA